jgi:hypothetical protein
MNSQQAKLVSIEAYLHSINIEPVKTAGEELIYLSPLRVEEHPSFHVNKEKNIWYDFGSGEGGNIIDLVMIIHKTGVKEALDILDRRFSNNSFSLLPAKKKVTTIEEPDINILQVTTLKSSVLKEYLYRRGLNYNLIAKYIHEVRYKNKGREYYGIGFKNNSGGYEIRNPLSKVCIGKKDISIIGNNSPVIGIFEGFIDFLSYICLFGEQTSDYLVLNSISQTQKAIFYCEQENKKVNLYLDNDQSGDTATSKFMRHGDKYEDMRSLYYGNKDLNDFLLAKEKNNTPR